MYFVKSVSTTFGILFILFVPQLNWAQSQDGPVKVYYEKTDEGLIILADNEGYCPYTLDLSMELDNMKASTAEKLLLVLTPQTKGIEISNVSIDKVTEASSFGFKSTYYWGNALKKPKDKTIYQLPFEIGESHFLSQGYDGNFSHQGKNSIDFNMDVGTDVCAARDGVVIEVKVDSNKGCPTRKCLNDANSIIIYHEDGTFSEYAHLKKNGSKVRVGDQVSKGQVIGSSGNTGFSSGPHLHFEVFYFERDERVTLPTKFRVSEKSEEYLKEKETYKSF